MKPGDAIALVTTALGFRPCKSCEERRKAMNAVNMERSIVEVAVDLAKAVVKPEKPDGI